MNVHRDYCWRSDLRFVRNQFHTINEFKLSLSLSLSSSSKVNLFWSLSVFLFGLPCATLFVRIFVLIAQSSKPQGIKFGSLMQWFLLAFELARFTRLYKWFLTLGANECPNLQPLICFLKGPLALVGVCIVLHVVNISLLFVVFLYKYLLWLQSLVMLIVIIIFISNRFPHDNITERHDHYRIWTQLILIAQNDNDKLLH